MFQSFDRPRKMMLRLLALLSVLTLAACGGIPVQRGGDSGPRIDPSEPVRVALLVPGGSGAATDSFLAQNLENAARLAIADLNGARIDLTVYNTGGEAAQASAVARQAVADGAQIILGPLFAEAANAAWKPTTDVTHDDEDQARERLACLEHFARQEEMTKTFNNHFASA